MGTGCGLASPASAAHCRKLNNSSGRLVPLPGAWLIAVGAVGADQPKELMFACPLVGISWHSVTTTHQEDVTCQGQCCCAAGT